VGSIVQGAASFLAAVITRVPWAPIADYCAHAALGSWERVVDNCAHESHRPEKCACATTSTPKSSLTPTPRLGVAPVTSETAEVGRSHRFGQMEEEASRGPQRKDGRQIGIASVLRRSEKNGGNNLRPVADITLRRLYSGTSQAQTANRDFTAEVLWRSVRVARPGPKPTLRKLSPTYSTHHDLITCVWRRYAAT